MTEAAGENDVIRYAAELAKVLRGRPRRRYAKAPPIDPTPHLYPEEQKTLAGMRPDTRKTFDDEVRRSAENRPGGRLPTLAELKAFADVGESVKGEYASSYKTLGDVLGHTDANLWVAANAVLSAQTPWVEHTVGATKALAEWHSAGRPTDHAGLEAVFGKTTQGNILVPGTGIKGVRNYSGDKAAKLRYIFARYPEVEQIPPTLIARSGIGKTPNFAHAFYGALGVPIDTHMGRLIVPSTVHRVVTAVEKNNPAALSELLEHQKKIASDPKMAMAYKVAVGKAAESLGWEPREVQEAVWTGVLGVMVAKHLGGEGKSLLSTLNHEAVRQGWDLHRVFLDPRVLNELERIGVPKKRVQAAVKAAAKRRPGLAGEVRSRDADALESGARRLRPGVPAGAEGILGKLRNRRRYAKAKPNPGAADALRRLRSKNQDAVREIAGEIHRALGLTPSRVRDALHDSAAASSPSAAQAIYHDGDPDRVRYAAAWFGLLSSTPSLAVFHVAADGPDSVYKWRVGGSLENVRRSLDHHGVAQRVLIPAGDGGFDVVVFDPGRKMRKNVARLAALHDAAVEESVGVGETVGGGSDAEGRSDYRSIISAYEAGGDAAPPKE